jgi:hypothetical protein
MSMARVVLLHEGTLVFGGPDRQRPPPSAAPLVLWLLLLSAALPLAVSLWLLACGVDPGLAGPATHGPWR